MQGVGWEYEEGEMKAHLGDACYRAARSRGAQGGVQTGPCAALHTSWICLASSTGICTGAGDRRAYLRHTHSSKFSSTDYLLITYTAPWKISGACFAVNCIYHTSASFAA